MKPFNKYKQIETADDYQEYAIFMFEEFLETFTRENGLIRDVREDDNVSESTVFLYTTRGNKLADRMKTRLERVGEEHFPEDDIEISTYLYIEDCSE